MIIILWFRLSRFLFSATFIKGGKSFTELERLFFLKKKPMSANWECPSLESRTLSEREKFLHQIQIAAKLQ